MPHGLIIKIHYDAQLNKECISVQQVFRIWLHYGFPKGSVHMIYSTS